MPRLAGIADGPAGHPDSVRIVITGASGNVGTALLRRLTGAGHDLVGVCRRPPGPVAPYDVATWHPLDLAVDGAERELTDVFRGADAVVHLAWGFQPSHDVAYLERVDVHGTRAVVGAAQRAGVAHLVHMSSLGAYSPGPDTAVRTRRGSTNPGPRKASRPSPTAVTRSPPNGCSTPSSAITRRGLRSRGCVPG